MKFDDSIVNMYLRCVLLLQLATSRFFHANAERSGIDSCLSYDVVDLEKYAQGLNFPQASETPISDHETIVADLPFGRLPIDWKRLSLLGDVLPVDEEFDKKFIAAYKILIIAHQRSLMRGESEKFVPIVDVGTEIRDFDTIGTRETASTGSWGSDSTEKQKSIQTQDEIWHMETTRFENQLDAVSQNATSPVASTPIESMESNRESGQNLLYTKVDSRASSKVEATTGLSDVERAYNQPSTSTGQKYAETLLVSSPSLLQSTIKSVDPDSTVELFTSTRTSIVSRVEDVDSSSVDDPHATTSEQPSATIKQTSSTRKSSSSSTKFSASSSLPFTNTDFHEEVTADGASRRVGKSTDTFWATSRGEVLIPKEVSSKLLKTTTATPSKNVAHEFSLWNHVTSESREGLGETGKIMFGNNFENSGSEMLSGTDEASTLMGREGLTTNFEASMGSSNHVATHDSAITEMVTDVSVSLKPSGQVTMTPDTSETSERKEGDESVITSGRPRDGIGSDGTTSRKLYTSSFESFTTSGDAEENPVHEDNAPISGYINANGSLPRLSTVVIRDKSTITSQGIVEHGVDAEMSENSTQSMENGTATRKRLLEASTPLAMYESGDVARSNDTSNFVTSSQTVFTDSSASSVEDQSTSLQQQTVDLSVAVSARASTTVGYQDEVNDVVNGMNTPTTEQTEVVQHPTNVSSYPLTNDAIATTDTDSSIVELRTTTTILDTLAATIHTTWKVDDVTSSPASKIVTTSSSIDSTKPNKNTESREGFNGLTTFSEPHLTNTVSEVTAKENDTPRTTVDATWIQRTSLSSKSKKLYSSSYLDDDVENGPENISTNRYTTIPASTIDINSSVKTDSTDFQIVEEMASEAPKITSVTEFVTAHRSSHPTPSSLDPKMRNRVENIPDKKIATFNIDEDVRAQPEILAHHPAMEIGSDAGHSTASTPAIGHVLKIHSRNKWNSFGSSSSHKTSKIPKKMDSNVFEYENSNSPIFVPLRVIPKSKTNFGLDWNRLPSETSLQKRAKSNMDVEKLYRWFYRHNEDLGDSQRRGSGTDSKAADIRCKN